MPFTLTTAISAASPKEMPHTLMAYGTTAWPPCTPMSVSARHSLYGVFR